MEESKAIRRVGDLEITEDLHFQRTTWTLQRIGWLVVAAVLLLALLGLFGTGPLSSASASRQGVPLRVDYERFIRFRSPTTLRIQFTPGASVDGTAHVWIDCAYLDGVEIQQITPEPDTVKVGPDRLTYAFRVNDSTQPAFVTVNFLAVRTGRTSGRVGLEGSRPVRLSQFIYP